MATKKKTATKAASKPGKGKKAPGQKQPPGGSAGSQVSAELSHGTNEQEQKPCTYELDQSGKD